MRIAQKQNHEHLFFFTGIYQVGKSLFLSTLGKAFLVK
jgi:hypothetical protein